MTIPVSVIVLTKNESAQIAETLSRLTAFEDVIIVDSVSTDGTQEIARSAGATVVNFEWNERYPKKKQWSLENAGATNDWGLLLDADEYPTPALVDEIKEIFRTKEHLKFAAFDIGLEYRFAGRYLQHGHRVTKRSLLNTSATHFPEIKDLEASGIREVEGHYQPQSSHNIGRLTSRLRHDDRDPVSTWFDRHNRYSDWEAHLRINEDARREIAANRTRNGSLFDRLPCKPILFFAYGFVARAGFLDGRAGFDYHFALATYYWQIGLKERELRRGSR